MSDLIGNAIPGWNTNSANRRFTPEGGSAIRVINDTGAPSIKGYIVQASASVDNAVEYTSDDDIDAIGIIYEGGILDGELMWVVTDGKVDVYYGTAVTRATFSRVPVVADSLSPGQAVNEALPVPPFATDKHFQEIGHPLESRGTPGLALSNVHFN